MNRKEAVARIKEILKRSKDTHNVYTPLELCDEMLDKILGLNSEIDILVMFNLEFLWALRERLGSLKNVWFLTPDEFKEKAAKGMGVNENKVIRYEYNSKIKIEESMPKFDVCIQNPPYKKSLHLTFLELGFNLLKKDGKMLIINPSSWLVLLREGKTKQKYDYLKEKIQQYVKSIEFFNAGKWFDVIKPYVPLELIYINKEKNNNENTIFIYDENIIEIQTLNDANLIGNYEIIKSIETKIIRSESIENYIQQKSKKYFVNLSWMVGNGYVTSTFYDNIERTYENRYNLINSTSNKITDTPLYAQPRNKKEIGNAKKWVSFNTKIEAQNFLDFITKSKLCKYLLIAYNIDQHIDSTYYLIPWLDWNISWNDNLLYEYFNLNKEEIKLIENTIEKYKKC